MNIDKQSRAYSIPKIIDLPIIEQPVETEFLIPEYCPDIIKILKCDMCARVVSKRIINNELELECCAEITIIFCGEDNKVSSVITKYNFTKNIENKLFNDNNVVVKLRKNHLNCRQTAARRIDVKGSINIEVSINSFDVQEVICDIQREDIQILRSTSDITSNIARNERQIVIEEELWLGSNKPDVNYIMRQSAVPIISECKLIGEKAVVKGNVKTDILYCSVENTAVNFSEMIPFSQIIELDIKDKTCNISADAELCSLEIKPILSNNTDAGFLITATINIIVNAECELNVQMISDCYSTRVETEITSDKAVFNKKIDSFSEKLLLKKTLSFNESRVSKVVDFWCNECKINDTINDNEITFAGQILGTVLFINAQNTPETADCKIDFKYSKKINDVVRNIFTKNKIEVTNCSYTIINESQVEVQVEVLLCSEIYQKIECDYIKEVVALDKCDRNDDSIIVYFCNKEESAWNVAKRFKTSLQQLKDDNGLTEDAIESQSVLVISRM